MNWAYCRQSEELTRVRAEISAIIRQQQELQSVKGKEEVENVKKELEKKKKELELQAELHKSQMDETLKIMEEGEKKRQEVLKEISKANLEEKKLHNEMILAKNDDLHKQKLETVNKLMDVEKMRYEEEARQMDKTEEKRFNGCECSCTHCHSIDPKIFSHSGARSHPQSGTSG